MTGAYRAERRREIHSAAPVDRLSDSGQRHPPSCRQAAGGLVPRGAVAPAGGHAAANGPAGRLDGGNGHCHGTLTVGRDGGSGGAGGGDGRHRLRWPCRSPLSRPLRRRSSSGYSWPAVWRSYGATARRRAGCFSMSPPRRWTFTISSTCCVCSNGSPPAGNCMSAWCCMTLTSPPCGPTASCCSTRGHLVAQGHAAGGDPAAGYPSLVRGGCPPRPAPGQRGPPGFIWRRNPARRNWNPDRAARFRRFPSPAHLRYYVSSM